MVICLVFILETFFYIEINFYLTLHFVDNMHWKKRTLQEWFSDCLASATSTSVDFEPGSPIIFISL